MPGLTGKGSRIGRWVVGRGWWGVVGAWLIVGLVGGVGGGGSAWARPLQVMLLGETLTSPEDGGSGFRLELWRQLIDAELRFDFVGTRHDRPEHGWFPRYRNQVFDPDHEGHTGWRVDHINDGRESAEGEGSLEDWLDRYTPDVAVVMLGRVDAVQGHEPQWTQRELKRLIETLRIDNERMAILLVTPPALEADHQRAVAALAEIYSELVQRENTVRSPLRLVDLHRGFKGEELIDPATAMPTRQGWHEMADRIAVSIMQLDDAHLRPRRRTSIQTWGAVAVVPLGASLVFYLLARSQIRREKESGYLVTAADASPAAHGPRGRRATRVS